MSFIKIKESILDDILERLTKETVGLSISTFLQKGYGIENESFISAYKTRLVNEGYITLHTPSGHFAKFALEFATLTERGLEFISEGGYYGAKYNELRKFENRKSDYIVGDNSLIKHSLQKLRDLESEIKTIKSEMDRAKIGRIEDILEIIFSKVFLYGHGILDPPLIPGPTSIGDILEKCQKAITYLEYHQVSNKRNFKDLHPMVVEVSSKQFEDGHYRDAVNNAFVKLVEVVRAKFPPKDGVDLMQEVFSKDKPKIKFSEDLNERQGMMFLYSGAVAGIRNKYGHKTAIIKDRDYAFELLCFASALFRLFEDQKIY
jgi:uncharacterized protein (TIGR02391 family)